VDASLIAALPNRIDIALWMIILAPSMVSTASGLNRLPSLPSIMPAS
jgi:hypothetical protein